MAGRLDRVSKSTEVFYLAAEFLVAARPYWMHSIASASAPADFVGPRPDWKFLVRASFGLRSRPACVKA